MKSPPADSPLAHLAQFLGKPESRVVDVFTELDAAKRIAALPLEGGGVGFTHDAAALLILTALLDPPEGRAVEAADKIAETTARRYADMSKPLFESVETLDATLPDIVQTLMAGAPTAKALTLGTDSGRIAASLRMEDEQVCSLTFFAGPEFPTESGAVTGRSTAIRCDALPALAAQLGCVDLRPASDARN